MMSGKHKLVYFNAPRARSFPIMVSASMAGVDLELVPVTYESWGKMKMNLDEIPFGKVPVLILPDGQRLAQTAAICQYFAMAAGLTFSDQLMNVRITEAVMTLDEIFISWRDNASLMGTNATDETKKQVRTKWVEEVLEPLMVPIETFIKKHGRNGHMLGDQLSAADVMATSLAVLLSPKMWDHLPAEPFAKSPAFTKVVETTMQNEHVKKIMAKF